MRKIVSKIVIASGLLGTTALTKPAFAQIAPGLTPPPVVQTIDQNGVDLQTGRLTKVLASISIGDGGPGSLGFNWSLDNSKQWPVLGYVHTTFIPEYQGGPIDTHYSVTIGGSTETFTQRGGSGPITNDQGRPSTLNGNTYTGADGTVATFGQPFLEGPDNNNLWPSNAPIASLTYPTGERLTYYWDIYYDGNVGSAYLRATTSSLGYQLRLSWASTTQVASAVVFNMKDESCDPTAATCTLTGNWPKLTWDEVTKRVTDNTGKWVGIATDSSGNKVITYPSGRTITFGNGAYNDGRATSTYSSTGAYTTQVGFAHYPENTSNAPSRIVEFSSGLIKNDTQYDNVTGTSLNTNYQYDSNGRLQTLTHPDGTVTTYGYDARGNLNSVTQGSASSTAIFPATCTNTKTCNHPTSVTDANGNRTDYDYDANSGGVATATLPAVDGARPVITYHYTGYAAPYAPAGTTAPTIYKPTKVDECVTGATCTAAKTVETSTVYDPNNNLLPSSVTTGSAASTGLRATTAYTYTDNGDVETVDGPLTGTADTTRNYYDAMRRPLGSIGPDPDGGGSMKRRAVAIVYDADGRPQTTNIGTATAQADTSLSGMTVLQSQVTAYDDQGRVAAVRAKAGTTTYSLTQNSYSDAGLLTCTAVRMNKASNFAGAPADGGSNTACTLGTQGSDGPDRITRYDYDGYWRPTTVTSGYKVDAKVDITNHYNSLGQLDSVTDGNGNVTSYTYDNIFGRLSKTCYADSATDCESLTYWPGGQIKTRKTRAGTTLSYTYDGLGRLATKVVPEGTVSYDYDNQGHTTSIAQGTTTLGFTYDMLGRNLTQAIPQGTITSAWDLAGNRTSIGYPDGLAIGYTHLVTGEVSSIVDGSTALATYAYDDLGNRTGVTYGNGTSATYAYDPVSRLTSLTNNLSSTANDLTIGGTGASAIAYNAASEITARKVSNSAYAFTDTFAVNRDYARNALNQYVTAGTTAFAYDANGNLTRSGSDYFCYDSENRLLGTGTASNCTRDASLSYDPAGRLASVVKGAQTTNFAYDGLDLIAEYKGSSLTADYVFGPAVDEPIVAYDNRGNRSWFASDERGSIVAITNANGAKSAIDTYDEYGIPGSNNAGRFQYTGQVWLDEIGLYYYKNRMFSMTLGRFMQTDPIGYGDGMNWYAYTHNDPVNGYDPLGLDGNTVVVTANKLPEGTVCSGNCDNDLATSVFGGMSPEIDGSGPALMLLADASKRVLPPGCVAGGRGPIGYTCHPTKISKSDKCINEAWADNGLAVAIDVAALIPGGGDFAAAAKTTGDAIVFVESALKGDGTGAGLSASGGSLEVADAAKEAGSLSRTVGEAVPVAQTFVAGASLIHDRSEWLKSYNECMARE